MIFMIALRVGLVALLVFVLVSFLGVIPGIPKYWGLIPSTDSVDGDGYDKFVEELVIPMAEKKGLTIELIEVFNEKLEFMKKFADLTKEERLEIADASEHVLEDDQKMAMERCLHLANNLEDDDRDEILDIIATIEDALSDLTDVDDIGTVIETKSDACTYVSKMGEALLGTPGSQTDSKKLVLIRTTKGMSSTWNKFNLFKSENYPDLICR